MKKMGSFEDFMQKADKKIKALNKGEQDILLKETVKEIAKEKELKKILSEQNYIEHFNIFLENIKENYVGKMLSFNFNNGNIITNDKLVIKNKGFPKSSFLIATLKDFKNLDGIEHFILLSINDIGKLEDEEETQLQLVKHHKEIDLKDIDIHSNDEKMRREEILSENLKHLNFISYNCKIVGMFYRKNDKEFGFSSQVNLLLSPINYIVAKPNKNIKNIIANYKAINESFNDKKDFKNFSIGILSETETETFTDVSTNPNVYINLDVFRSKRTGFFGKTRLGKSNNAKIILSQFIQDNARKTNINLKDKTGVVVFDENGEYANTNNQDKTSIYEKFKNTGYVKVYNINKTKKDNLLLNFYLSPSETMELFEKIINESGKKSIYLENFLSTDFINSAKIKKMVENNSDKPIILNDLNKIKFQLFWAMLNKAGFKYEEKVFFDEINKLIENPFELSDVILKSLEDVYKNEKKDDEINFNNLKSKKGDNDEVKFSKMCSLIDDFMDIYIHNPDLLIRKEKRKFIHIETLLEMFNTTNKSGYKILRKFRDFHSEKTLSNIDDLVKEVCDEAVVAIIDLSSTVNSEVKKYYAERITKHIFNKQVYYFTQNLLSEKPSVLGYYEEAHNLFPADGKNDRGVYYKIAKEGAKYNFGMIYVTQSPSNISSELLVQTENFFIGHLSAPKEVAALNNLNYAYEHLSRDIMTIRKVGFMRVLTDNHRYPIPVQIDKFE